MSEKLSGEILKKLILEAASIAVLGHINPDGDSIGSVLGVYNYIGNIRGNDPGRVFPYLDHPSAKFSFLKGFDRVRTEPDEYAYDLAIVLDAADTGRMGRFSGIFKAARVGILIDHHVTNPGFGDYCLIDGEASSASELAYRVMDENFVDRAVAECIYTGIIHDTGVFRYPSTHGSTMSAAADCMRHGIDFTGIIEESFFNMSLGQKKVLGYLLYHMKSRLDGRIAYSYIDLETREHLSAEYMDLDGMIDYIRTTDGAMMAVFLYETREKTVKASLRSNTDDIDVSLMALRYGGGGHKRAAGCFMGHDFEKDIEELEALFREQLS